MPLPKGYKFSIEQISKRSSSLIASQKKRKIADHNGNFTCSKCLTVKPPSEFHKDTRRWNGLKSQCKECHVRVSIATRSRDLYLKSKRLSEAKRRARQASCECRLTRSELNALEERFGYTCLKCGTNKNLQWDHVIPLAIGGMHSIDNLQRLCRSCNEKKQARFADYRTEQQKLWVIEFERVK